MPSDGRYGYSHPNPPSYDYNPYPPPVSAYEPPQVVQPPSLRSSRSTNPPSQPHSPPLSNHHYQAPSYQQQGYGPGQYQHPPPQPPPQAQQPPPPPHPSSHWPNEGWGHYNQQQYPPHPPPTHASAEPPYTSGPGRPEQVSSSSSEPRGYAPSHPPPPPSSGDSRRGEDRHHAPPPPPPPHSSSASSIPPPPSSAHHHQQQQPQQPPPPPHHHHQAQQHNNQGKPSRREKESPPAIPPPGTPSNLDFMKLLESYRIILDGTEALSAPSSSSSSASRTPPAAETIERMLQSATYGWHTLDEALAQHSHRQSGGNAAAPTESTRSPKEKDPEEATPKEPANGATASSSSSSKRQKVDDTVQEGQTCLGCNATSTPEWRRGPMGPRTLCNACGLVYAKLIKKRFRETLNMKGQNGKNIPPQAAGDDSLEGESEDDDGYSQDRRSELVEGRD